MKRTTIKLLLLSTLVLTQSACSKKDNLDKIKIDETGLTSCPENAHCEYLFTESADIEGTMPTFKSGGYRLFWANVDYKGVNSKLYLKAPMQGNKFQLDKSAIVAGNALLFRNCPTCLMTPVMPVTDGYVKGVSLTPEKQADQTKWLLEAKIILKDEIGGTTYRDTVYVKQYFYPNFVYN
jgi:hypothetical protein